MLYCSAWKKPRTCNNPSFAVTFLLLFQKCCAVIVSLLQINCLICFNYVVIIALAIRNLKSLCIPDMVSPNRSRSRESVMSLQFKRLKMPYWLQVALLWSSHRIPYRPASQAIPPWFTSAELRQNPFKICFFFPPLLRSLQQTAQ